jgi:hypothetical protein
MALNLPVCPIMSALRGRVEIISTFRAFPLTTGAEVTQELTSPRS